MILAAVRAQGVVSLSGLTRRLGVTPVTVRRDVTALADQGLVERGVQALLVAPSTGGQAGAALLRWLGSLPIPVVLMERLPPPELATLAMDSVVTAHAFGAGLAVRHLVTLGHDRIGLVTSRFSPTSEALRIGWSKTTSLLGLPAARPAAGVVLGRRGQVLAVRRRRQDAR